MICRITILFIMAITSGFASIVYASPDEVSLDEFLAMWVGKGGFDIDDRELHIGYALDTHRKAWIDVASNEFKKDAFLDEMRAKILEASDQDWKEFKYETILRLDYSEYDKERKGFPITVGPRFSIHERLGSRNVNEIVQIFFPEIKRLNFIEIEPAEAEKIREKDGTLNNFYVLVRWQPKAIVRSKKRIIAKIMETHVYRDRKLSDLIQSDTNYTP